MGMPMQMPYPMQQQHAQPPSGTITELEEEDSKGDKEGSNSRPPQVASFHPAQPLFPMAPGMPYPGMPYPGMMPGPMPMPMPMPVPYAAAPEDV